MDYTLKLFPQRPLELHGSAQYLARLIKDGVIKENEDGTAVFCKPFKLHIEGIGANHTNKFLETQWLPLFPTQEIIADNIANYYVSGNTAHCKRYMKEFLKMHKDKYSPDCILIATSAYLYDRFTRNWNGVAKNYNFIRKDLEAWCQAFLDNPDALYRKANNYYEHIKRTATRTRRKRIQSAEYRLPTLVGSPVGGVRDGDSGVKDRRTTSSGSGDTEGRKHIQPSISIRPTAGAITINKAHKE